MRSWVKDVKKNDALSELIELNNSLNLNTTSKYTIGIAKSNVSDAVGIYFDEGTDKYLEYEWFYVETLKDLKETLKLVPDDAEIKREVRLIKNMRTNKYSLQGKDLLFMQ